MPECSFPGCDYECGSKAALTRHEERATAHHEKLAAAAAAKAAEAEAEAAVAAPAPAEAEAKGKAGADATAAAAAADAASEIEAAAAAAAAAAMAELEQLEKRRKSLVTQERFEECIPIKKRIDELRAAADQR